MTTSSAPPSMLESVFNHIALPPLLPSKQETNLDKIELVLAQKLLDASRTLRDSTNERFGSEWDSVRRSLETCILLNTGGRLNQTSLLAAFREIDVNGLLILHVTEQNAGILIRHDINGNGEKVILFEAFEVSPRSEDVLASQNALQWDFPGCAVTVSLPTFNDPSFQLELAIFLEQASTESIKRFAARANKAGISAVESRNTVDPSVVTQILMSILEVHGSRVFPPLLRKRVRDDVCWFDGEKPWRRSAFWLLLRVGVQRYLSSTLGRDLGRLHYKFLMCIMLVRLMNGCMGILNTELVVFLKAKLCRRLVKLEVERDRVPPNLRNAFEYLSTALEPHLTKSITSVTERVDVSWANFKKTILRPVLPLPRRANLRHLCLTLPNSRPYLQQILTEPLFRYNGPQFTASFTLPLDYQVSAATAKKSIAFAHRYLSLAKTETEIELSHTPTPDSDSSCERRCVSLSQKIEEYLNNTAGSYESDPEQQSIMILTVMELWMSMDQCATKLYTLLMDYNPGFPSNILDVLQLPRFQDMCRLKKIRDYLKHRHAKCYGSRTTIFIDPERGCFAERYFDESPDSESLQGLLKRIEMAAQLERTRKEQEWQRLSLEYENLIKSIAESACVYYTDEKHQTRLHNDRQCTKCFLQRKANRFRIKAHEHPLPSNTVQAKTVVFELACPKAFTAYREATWQILGTLAFPAQMEVLDPKILLKDYSELRGYVSPNSSSFSLASTTKSFLMTHYANPRFPVQLGDVCLTNGLRFGYFDVHLNVWPSRQDKKPSFAHRCQSIIPANSPFSSLNLSSEFSIDANGPSSYEIIASQTKCPSGLNVHEFMAYQTLCSGKSRRWPQILVELGSSNLNFSTEATTFLMSQLALQVGPAYKDEPLGKVHRIFRDESFSRRLVDQLGQRLESVSSNWRETTCMETLITLILRLFSLSTTICDEAVKLLEKARNITSKWINILRSEIQTATDAETSRRCSRYAFWAALLCRRTFAIYADGNKSLEPENLESFIVCSIALQDNLVGDPDTLPPLLKNSFVRDLKMVYQLRNTLRHSFETNPDSLLPSIATVWPSIEGDSSRSVSQITFLSEPHLWWVEIVVNPTLQTKQQTVHFHLLEGHLLIMGQPVGKLPEEYRTAVVLKQLFGNQSLLTYPSSLPGMAYMLSFVQLGHEIHLGFRNGNIIVRARLPQTILELVPSHIFRGSTSFDLPTPLVENCVHWLDLNTQIIEIRQQPDIWRPKKSNWLLNMNTGQATRRTVTLVDPQSPLFQRVARIFDHFEYRHNLTVFQPATRGLSVELRRLELSFFVNRRNLLESTQLRSEIDPDQDAGTWYGLNSKLVLRELDKLGEPTTQRQRSIIVPMGVITYRRNGPHVAVDAANNGDYGRFTINEVLGRLDCPAEPRLLYLKAQFHAYTSFTLPDPLTGRTGTEEALHCLRSGYCQPWTALTVGPTQSLLALAKLTPRREYYPRDLKVMQKPFWDPHLTTTIQSDALRTAVETICIKSRQLSIFSTQKIESLQLGPGGEYHLTLRSHVRRQAYQRPSVDSDVLQAVPDVEYIARDRYQASQERSNVFKCTSIIRDWPSRLYTTTDLVGILQTWPNIGGYHGSFEKILLSDLLDVDFPLEWGSLVNLCRKSSFTDRHRLIFLFAIMSFRRDADMSVLSTLIGFCVLEDLKQLEPPKWPSYIQFRQNQAPQVDYLLQLTRPCLIPYGEDERAIFGFNLSSKQRRQLEAAERAHEKKQENDSKALARFLLDQWPCIEPSIDGLIVSEPTIDISQALGIILPEWQRLFQNLDLTRHIAQVQGVLDQHHCEDRMSPPTAEVKEQEVLPTRLRGGEFPTLPQYLLGKTALKVVQADYEDPWQSTVAVNGDETTVSNMSQNAPGAEFTTPLLSTEILDLQSIIGGIRDSKSRVRQQYGTDLMQSLGALQTSKNALKKQVKPVDMAQLPAEIANARLRVRAHFDQLCKAFEKDDSGVQWLQQGGLWPIITPVTLLENLRSTSDCIFGTGMKEALVHYALSVTALQRLLRIYDAHQGAKPQRLIEEQENVGHSNWKPLDHPDWLLLEIDSNMLIRPGQVDVALATISPASRSNSVLQMNMGQGKTSCIMPMAAAELADGASLLRVVVPKPLLLQTAQLLHGRLGGLVGRELRHVPFSRKTPTNSDTIKAFYNIHREIQKSSGILLALPEHLLSFMLSGLQRLSDGHINEASSMIKVQNFLNRTSRDILDECDNILALRTQLIYPSGSQKIVDGHPHRWETAQILLARVDGHLFNLQKVFPQSVEVIRRPQGGFPVVFFLRKDVEDTLIARLVDDIFRGRTTLLPECNKPDRLVIKQFISEPKVSPEVAQRISEIVPDKPAARQTIHLLRGLLVHRILLMALKKRWNVQYGLHPGRDPLSVPFLAKGTPSDQAEWGHPDVAILFTCLSFYYDGLSVAQLRQSLEHVLKSDDPSQTYDRFSQNSDLPDSLRDWNAINVDDEAQLKEIWQHVRYNVMAVDYFLNNFVFPRHAKQFHMKLQASGWDIPLFSTRDQSAKSVGTLTTGFSGTNDWKEMLPLTISQRDLPRLSHTNAEVLTYLLQPRNRTYVLAANHRGRHLSELDLLRKITKMNIRVLIDAGAQILEMDNGSLAKAWLEIFGTAPAVVYFKEDNKPWVRYRQGHEIPLLASPFVDDLGDCLVYLDEAHTRGTDLKMPVKARGALTLGLGQTKDNTVQAAMRLRQLGTTQAVVFLAPPEVHQSIIDLQKKKSGDTIDSLDVICWLLEQTCSGIEQLQPLYYSQGVDFCRRAQAAVNYSDFLEDADQRQSYLRRLRQIEQQTLEQLYGLNQKVKPTVDLETLSPEIARFMKDLTARRRGFQDTGDAVHSSALQEVEQEREVAYEVENVRELEKPLHYTPFSFPGLHKDIISYMETGRLAADSGGYEHAFVALQRTQMGQKFGIRSDATSCRLYVSAEFSKTVKLPLGRPYDNFQRHVNWIIWSSITETALIIIPEEAEQLLAIVFDADTSPTHLLTYAAPVTRKMLQFNDFKFYAVPSLPTGWEAPMWLRVELGIFAGRLYFEYFEYNDLCEYFGANGATAGVQEDVDELTSTTISGVDGIIDGSVDDEMESGVTAPELTVFTKRPLTFLQEWLAVRRKGQDFSHTPMGHVCQGKPLLESHPFFVKSDNSRKEVTYLKKERGRNRDEEEVSEDLYDEYEQGDDEIGFNEKDGFDDSQLLDDELVN